MDVREFAELVVDALFVAKIVEPQDVERAVDIVAEELNVREAMGNIKFGDFPVPHS